MTDTVHPRALDDVPGHAPGRVTLPSGSHSVDREAGGVILGDVSERDVQALAAAYDVEPSALRPVATCEVVKADGDVCGRELPCAYHSDE